MTRELIRERALLAGRLNGADVAIDAIAEGRPGELARAVRALAGRDLSDERMRLALLDAGADVTDLPLELEELRREGALLVKPCAFAFSGCARLAVETLCATCDLNLHRAILRNTATGWAA